MYHNPNDKENYLAEYIEVHGNDRIFYNASRNGHMYVFPILILNQFPVMINMPDLPHSPFDDTNSHSYPHWKQS